MIRSCTVNGDKKGYFHTWSNRSEVVGPSPFTGGHSGGQLAWTVGLVELEDGRVIEAMPSDITFTDTDVVDVQTKIYELPDKDSVGNLSDGYHTFNELYYHRMMLFSVICNTHKDVAWKSWKHEDGSMYDNMFIVGVSLPNGDYSYHYNAEFWDKFNVKELENAPVYDGHLPEDITRLEILNS